MRRPHLGRNTWVVLGIFAAAFIYGLTASHRDIILPTEWEARSAAGVQAMGAGRLDDAERYFLEAMQLASEFAENDPRRGTSLDNLAGVRKEQRRFAEAEALYRDALGIFERAGPRSERQLALVYNDLGTVRAALDDFDEAEAFIRRAIEINERVRGPKDPETATSLRNYAAVMLLQGKVGKAAAAATRASTVEEREPRQ